MTDELYPTPKPRDVYRLADALIAHGFDGAEPAAPPASTRRAGPALAAVAALVVVVIWWRR